MNTTTTPPATSYYNLTMDDRRAYWKNYADYVRLFGADLVDTMLEALPEHDIVGEYDSPLRNYDGKHLPGHCYHKPRRLRRMVSKYYRFTNDQGWEKSVCVPCNVYLIPHTFQHLNHGEFLQKLLLAKHPWLSAFKLSCYGLGRSPNDPSEFYVTTQTDGLEYSPELYVPVEALVNGDVEAIKKRNETYLRWYHLSDEQWEALSKHPVTLAFFAAMEQQ